jgi:hypothetical protein
MWGDLKEFAPYAAGAGARARVPGGRGAPPTEWAKTPVYLATATEVEGLSGGYYAKCRPAPLAAAPDALDDATAERLWAVSEELVGLR